MSNVPECLYYQELSADYARDAMFYLSDGSFLEASRRCQRLAANYHNAMWDQLQSLIQGQSNDNA